MKYTPRLGPIESALPWWRLGATRPRVQIAGNGRVRWTNDFYFVSYARTDFEMVQPFLGAAANCDYAFWIDQEDLPVGSRWSHDIVAAIRASRAVILFCS